MGDYSDCRPVAKRGVTATEVGGPQTTRRSLAGWSGRTSEQARLKRKQERLARRRKREESLFRVAERWQRCETLRGYMEAVRKVADEEVGGAEADPKIARWLVWAGRVAERHDPLERLRKSSPRRRPR